MSTSVELPALGESVTEGTVSRWLKQVGDTVEADEALLEVSTDKVDTEIPSPAAGTLLEIKVAEDETVEVGTVLCVIGDADEAGGDSGESEGDSGGEPQTSDDTDADEARQQDQATEPQNEDGAEKDDAADDDAEAAPKRAAEDSKGGGEGTNVELPALGESVTEGTVSRWLKQVGDEVEADEALLEVSTDKVDTEIPSPVAGTVLEIKVAEDETVEVGTVLCVIGDADAAPSGDSGSADSGEAHSGTEKKAEATEESMPANEPESQGAAGDEGGQEPIPTPEPAQKDEAKQESKQDQPKQESQQEKPTQSGGGTSAPQAAPRAQGDESAYVTPLVRKLAQQHGVDLASVTGTGVGGRIRKQDILTAAEEAKKAAEKAAEKPAEAPAAEKPAAAAAQPSPEAQAKRGTTEKITRLRATIAKRMVESLQVSAQLTATVEVDLTNISRLRKRAKDDFARREGAKLSYLPFITQAAVEALKQFPKVNATMDAEAGTITYAASENIGIAVDTEKGLMVPVIKDAGDLNLAGLARKISDLAERTRTNKVTPDDLTGGTFTITNYGSAGTLFDTPIINQPQVAILGTGALVKRPMVISDANLGETIAIRDMMYLSMSYDHRLVDGADAARFLSAVKARLEEGDFAAELGL